MSASITLCVESHFAAFTLMLLPIEALVFRVVFNRYSKLNYPEWLVITTLLTVQTFVIWLLMWIKWTFPRLRVDQILTLEWKYLVPIGLVNLLLMVVIVVFKLHF